MSEHPERQAVPVPESVPESRTWQADLSQQPDDTLPPDLTRGGSVACLARVAGSRPAVCTRGKGHTGRHAAGTGSRVVAVWSDEATR